MHSRLHKTYRPLVEVWFTIGISDRSAFYLTMANAAMLFERETSNGNRETAESMKYYTRSLRSVNKRLQDPVDAISEGVMELFLDLLVTM